MCIIFGTGHIAGCLVEALLHQAMKKDLDFFFNTSATVLCFMIGLDTKY